MSIKSEYQITFTFKLIESRNTKTLGRALTPRWIDDKEHDLKVLEPKLIAVTTGKTRRRNTEISVKVVANKWK